MTKPSIRRALSRNIRDGVLNSLLASPMFPRGLRWRALRLLGFDVQRCTINAKAFIGGHDLHIGRDAFINYEAFLDGAGTITIGDRVSFGPRVTVLTGSHELGDEQRRAGRPEAEPVVIEDGAWIGSGVTILPGVTVGKGALVAAGATVVHDVEPNTLVAGVPAKLVRRLESHG